MTDAALRVEDTPPVMAIARAALYLRVSTGRRGRERPVDPRPAPPDRRLLPVARLGGRGRVRRTGQHRDR